MLGRDRKGSKHNMKATTAVPAFHRSSMPSISRQEHRLYLRNSAKERKDVQRSVFCRCCSSTEEEEESGYTKIDRKAKNDVECKLAEFICSYSSCRGTDEIKVSKRQTGRSFTSTLHDAAATGAVHGALVGRPVLGRFLLRRSGAPALNHEEHQSRDRTRET